MFTVTLDQIRAARHPACGWTEDAMMQAIEARFPGVDPINLGDLCRAWLADAPNLAQGTLQQCIMLARALGVPKREMGGAARALVKPLEALALCAAWCDAQNPPPPAP